MAGGVSEGKHWRHPKQQEQWLLRIQQQSTLRESHSYWVPEREEVCEPFVKCKNIPVMPDEGSKDQLMSVSAHLRKSWKTIAITDAYTEMIEQTRRQGTSESRSTGRLRVQVDKKTTCWFRGNQLHSSLESFPVCHTHPLPVMHEHQWLQNHQMIHNNF